MALTREMQEQRKELEDQLQLLNQKLHLLKELRTSEGWPLFSELLRQQIRNYRTSILDSDDDGLDGAVRLSQRKEYLSGLVHASKLVEMYASDFAQERDIILESLRGLEDEYSNEVDDA